MRGAVLLVGGLEVFGVGLFLWAARALLPELCSRARVGGFCPVPPSLPAFGRSSRGLPLLLVSLLTVAPTPALVRVAAAAAAGVLLVPSLEWLWGSALVSSCSARAVPACGGFPV